eukprot:scaffold6733_cov33-Phaeocystis_antarctica.AAC.1
MGCGVGGGGPRGAAEVWGGRSGAVRAGREHGPSMGGVRWAASARCDGRGGPSGLAWWGGRGGAV